MTIVACQFKIDETEKNNAFAVIESYGLNPSHVLRSFLLEISHTGRIPLDLSYNAKQPNVHTAQLLRDVKAGIEPMSHFENINDLLQDLQNAKN